MEEDKPGLADEVALGVTYNQIDDYLEGKTIDPQSQTIIEGWWNKTAHKRHLPITILMIFGNNTPRKSKSDVIDLI